MSDHDAAVVAWLTRFAAELGVPPPTGAQIDEVLELAAVAAHASARQAAPVACWLAASAGIDPSVALAVAQRLGG